MGPGRSSNAGFTLIEVLAALSILAVGLLGLALLQITAIKGNANAASNTIATEVAQDKLESFRQKPWDNIISQADPTAFGASTTTMDPVYSALPVSAGDNVTVRGRVFQRIWRVNTNSPSAGMKAITVWACWQDDRGFWHNVMLVTLRTSVG